ncbi:hypothetical protein MUO93_00400 [Candidatus Bathyarchaeota archaeon]|nr:hypothetical protein [Candidatus Bathyarchaeota archaeon]
MAQPSRSDSAKRTTSVSLRDGAEVSPIGDVFPPIKRASFEAGRAL